MSDLQERLDRAERALSRSGFILVDGAQEWKPPIGPSASPLLDRIDLLTFLLRELRDGVEGEWCFPDDLNERIDAALAGKLPEQDDFLRYKRTDYFPQNISLTGKIPERQDTEWTDAASTPTAEDYRELQAQHDQLQSKYKAAMDFLSDLISSGSIPWILGQELTERAKALLTGHVPDHTEQPLAMVPEGWQLVPVEPTEEILRAIRSMVLVESCYRAMLAAAPKPEGAA